MPFGEEVGIGHDYPVAFHVLERHDDFICRQRLALLMPALQGGNAFGIQPGNHQRGATQRIQATLPVRMGRVRVPIKQRVWQIEPQRHVVALHDGARIAWHQRHIDFLPLCQYPLFVQHVPLRKRQSQQQAGSQPRAPGQRVMAPCACTLFINRPGRRNCRVFAPQVDAAQSQRQGAAHCRQQRRLVRQRPMQGVIKGCQLRQQHEQGQHQHAPPPCAPCNAKQHCQHAHVGNDKGQESPQAIQHQPQGLIGRQGLAALWPLQFWQPRQFWWQSRRACLLRLLHTRPALQGQIAPVAQQPHARSQHQQRRPCRPEVEVQQPHGAGPIHVGRPQGRAQPRQMGHVFAHQQQQANGQAAHEGMRLQRPGGAPKT